MNTQEIGEEVVNNNAVEGKVFAAVAKNLADKTRYNGYLQNSLKQKNNEIYKADDLHIATLGRLSKYEDDIVDEALKYAFDKHLYIKCNSKKLSIKSNVNWYEKKDGELSKTKKAHYTIHGKFLKMCNTLTEEPVYYDGNFCYYTYKEGFDKLLKKDIRGFKTLEDLFDL